MGMTIDEAIKTVDEAPLSDELIRKEVCEIIGACEILFDVARKYQKIEDIYYHQSGEALENSLRAVVEDGKID